MRLGAPFSLHGFPVPFQRRFPALLLCLANFCGALFACLQKLEHCASTSSLLRLLAQSSVLPLWGRGRVSHADGSLVFKVRYEKSGNKKSPHNNLNLTILSGMALVRVRYVAIRKLKTCSGSFGSRAGTLNKYVILNCWNRLPQKSSRVNVNLSGQGPSILLRKTVLSLKSPTGAFIAALRFANANF